MKAALQTLQNSINGELFYDELHKTLYATDASVYRMLPLAVAFPKDEDDIQVLIEFARENKTSLIPRTAGTSLAGQCVGEGIVVDVSKYFTNIIELDEVNKTIRVQPGVIRDELNAYLKPYGLFFGPNTSTSNRCMIGGMVGNNSSGTTSIKYGVTREKVLALRTLLTDGSMIIFEEIASEVFTERMKLENLEGNIYRSIFSELSSEESQNRILKEFPKPEIHRRNTGYAIDSLLENELFGGSTPSINLCNLLAGSEGTLAFTTEITLDLDDLPPVVSALVVTHYDSIDNCLQDVPSLMQNDLYTCEMIDKVILDCTKNNTKYEPYRFFVKNDPKALLLLELRAEDANDLERQVETLLSRIKENSKSYHSPVLRGSEIDMAMELRKAGLGLLGNMVGDKKAVACIEDTAVVLSDLPSYIKEFTQLMSKYEQNAVYYAHAGAGELHLRPILNLKQKEDVALFRKITTDVALLTKKYGGSFSGEHGDGIVRAEFIPLMIGEANYELLKRIKTSFDPDNIFNPGKIVDAYKMDNSLRYVPGREEPEIQTILDFSSNEGILKLAENCNGSGDCRKTELSNGAMCPSYHATRNEKDTTRARANMLREVLTTSDKINKFDSEELKEVFDLCLSCKACASECPSNVDVASLKAEFQYQYRKSNGVKRSDKLFAFSSRYHKMASRFPRLANAVFSSAITANMIKNYSRLASKRSIPLLSTSKLSKAYQNTDNQYIKKIYLFVDEFSKYLDVSIANDAIELLGRLGYEIEIIDHLGSARALISKGFLEEAKQQANDNIAFFKKKITESSPLVGIEPSAILSFRDEFLKLADDRDSAKAISKNSFLIEEFLASEIEKGNITSDSFTSEAKGIKIHVHCHQKALSNQKVTFDILNLPTNYKPTIIPSGCCGMAGSFGYEKEHYEVSMKIGELKLFPSIRKASQDTIISANGNSCRHQIKDGTQREARHPVSILRDALL